MEALPRPAFGSWRAGGWSRGGAWREGSELLVVFRDSSDFAARFFLNLVALDVGVAEERGRWWRRDLKDGDRNCCS